MYKSKGKVSAINEKASSEQENDSHPIGETLEEDILDSEANSDAG